MAVAFQMPSGRPIEFVGFAWSPLFEAVLSMPAVAHPKHTPMHLPWARRCRDLPPDLLDELAVLAGGFGGFVPAIFEVGFTGDHPTFDDELEMFSDLDLDLVVYELSLGYGGMGCGPWDGHGPHLVHDRAYQDEVVAAAASAQQATLARQLFDDPAAVRDRYVRLLQRYWEAAFHDEWERILPRIEAEVTDGARALVTAGAAGLVSELLPEGRWDAATSTIVVNKDWDGTCDVAERGGLLLVPTVYGWPRVLIELAEPWPVSIIFPLRDLRQPEVPLAVDREIADGLRALGDETRLQIARMVAEQPRSTKELAELLQLSDSAVSRHLKILDAAGVVSGRRDGYFVLYQLQPQRIAQLGGGLRHTLGLTQANGGEVPPLPVSLSRTGRAQRATPGRESIEEPRP